jgi:hypothetical protein
MSLTRVLVSTVSVFAVVGVLATGCSTILGDFSVGSESPSSEGGADGPDDTTVGPDGGPNVDSAADTSRGVTDSGSETSTQGDADAGCASGLTACSSGCVNLQDAGANCGSCDHSCNGGACTAATCGPYPVVSPTGKVDRLATDGTRVVWADTVNGVVLQIAATGGTPMTLAPVSAMYGSAGAELALAANGTVAFTYTGNASLGFATVDHPDSGQVAYTGGLLISAVSMSPSGGHVFYFQRNGTQGSLMACPLTGQTIGTCASPSGGVVLDQTAGDDSFMAYDSLGTGLFVDTISSNMQNQFSGLDTQSLAVDGTWVYWTQTNDGGATYSINRALESPAGSSFETPIPSVPSPVFATDGTNLYYFDGSSVSAQPAGGGVVATLAPATTVTQMAVGGGLLVWTDGKTISGIVVR